MRSSHALLGMGTPYYGYISDSFNRADSASLGNLDTGQTWDDHGVGISSNKAYSTSGFTLALIDPGSKDMETTLVVSTKPVTAGSPELLQFRHQGGSSYLALASNTTNGTIELKRQLPSGASVLGTVAYSAGDSIKVRAQGSSIKVFVNGVSGISVTETNFLTESLMLLICVDTTVRFDSFLCTRLSTNRGADAFQDWDAIFSTRLARTRYAGYCCKLRRASDNAESDFGFSGGYLDQSAIATWLGASDGFLKTWYDQREGGHDATQTTTANQPKYIANGISSAYAGFLADGTNDQMAITNPITHGTADWTIATVFHAGSVAAHDVLYGGASAGELCIDNFGGAGYIIKQGTSVTVAGTHTWTAASNTQVWYQRSGNVHTEKVNNGTADTATASVNYTSSTSRLFENSSSQFGVSTYAEILISQSALSNPYTDQKAAFGLP